MEENSICPYPGLRPFNEDESIFFKGREEHIDQIVKQLEEKKFLMLTGASGDGKSSLVYAGVIPNARAGFFKAKFNNWVIADFRPEREPLENMARSIEDQLKTGDVKKLEKELSYGFSSLIDIYKSSKFWVDQYADEYKNSSLDEQKKLKRKGANLMILVDQFEEFFTNQENYSNGKTSIESQTVVNLLLETTRLAIEQDVPIYIVCTMRSDYIGQCASFRGLPEYIGYSQFFVPRLKRKEIYQVIEEPALLNGNKISKRLVEMLINEMNDGIDQLPVLQHALNQIWQKANKGTEEMDMIHFAQINGIPKNQLNSEDRSAFEEWFNALPEFKKEFFKKSSLGDVLDAHANELYELAAENAGKYLINKEVSKDEAKLIVEATFKCLTKIDESRAVRNRMTLEEVTQIINQPHIDTEIVGAVLNVFRQQGNTFLKPFVTDLENSKKLYPNSVLDITHESLIRNWNSLTEWARQEHDHLLNWQDFNKQLQRWVDNNKSSGYLLPIGPLTFFESWFNQVKPNKYWLARYDEREITREQKLEDAEIILSNANQFIKRSARRLFFSRTVLKYGADKLIAAFGLLLLIFSCTYFYFDFRKKQNETVIEDVQGKGMYLLSSKYIKNSKKADFIWAYEKLNPGKFKELLTIVEGDSNRLEINRQMLIKSLGYGKNPNENDHPLIVPLFLNQMEIINKDSSFFSKKKFAKNINNMISIVYENMTVKEIEYDSVSIRINKPCEEFYKKVYDSSLLFLEDTASIRRTDISLLMRFFQTFPEVVNYDSIKLMKIVKLISPFEEGNKFFNTVFSREKEIKYFGGDEVLKHNGGYYLLCNLYALTGDFDKLNRCYDSLKLNNKSFMAKSFGCQRFVFDLIINSKFNSRDGEKFIKKLEGDVLNKEKNPFIVLVLDRLIINNKDVSSYSANYLFSNNSWQTFDDLQIQLNEISEGDIVKYIDYCLKVYENGFDEDEKNFMQSLLYKSKANLLNRKTNSFLVSENINKSFQSFLKVSKKYISEDMSIGTNGSYTLIKREDLFKYPIYISLTQTWDNFSFYQYHSIRFSHLFLEIAKQNNLIKQFYFSDVSGSKLYNKFLFYFSNPFLSWMKEYKDYDISTIDYAIENWNSSNKAININFLKAIKVIYYNRLNELNEAKKVALDIDFDELFKKEKTTEISQNANYYYGEVVNELIAFFAKNEDLKIDRKLSSKNKMSIHKIISKLPENFRKRNAYLISIDSIQNGQIQKSELALSFLDTLLNGYISKSPKYGNKLFELLGRLSTNDGNKIAMNLMKDKNDKVKPSCLDLFIKGMVKSSNYYLATTFIPDYISSSTQLGIYTTFLNCHYYLVTPKLKRWDYFYDGEWSSNPLENNEGDENIWYSGDE